VHSRCQIGGQDDEIQCFPEFLQISLLHLANILAIGNSTFVAGIDIIRFAVLIILNDHVLAGK